MATQLDPIFVPDIADEPNAVGLDLPGTPDNAVGLPVPGVNNRPLPPDVAKERAAKTEQGLGPVLKKNKDQLYEDYQQGLENDLRKQAASSLDAQKAIQRNDLIQQMSVAKQGPLDPEEIRRVLDPFNPLNKPTDPETVVERAYAQKYVSSLNTAVGYMTDSLLSKSKAEMPKQVEDTLDEGSELLTKNNFIRTRMQNTKMLTDEQSYVGYGADFAKTMFQPYVEYKERGLIGGKLEGLGLGTNLDEAGKILYRLPMPEFKKKFNAAMDYLEKDNPQLAASWAQAMLGQDTFESALNNTFTAISIPDYLAIGKLGAKLVGKGRTLSQVRKATHDIVESAAKDPNATPATAAEGAGDVAEAAVQRIAKQNTDALNGVGDPIADAKRTLLSTWYDDAVKFVSNPGTYLSRELLTRIQDGFARDGEALFGRIGTMNRVERTPQAVTDPNAIRAYKDSIRQDYKGPANTLLDIEGPIREPVSGTYWYKERIGNYDATQFPDVETAKGFAKQIGISDPIIKGEAPTKVYIPGHLVKRIEAETGEIIPARLDVKVRDGKVEVTHYQPTYHFDENGATIGVPDEKNLSATPIEPTTEARPGYVGIDVKTGLVDKHILTPEQAAIEQQGLGFHIERWTPMRENNDLVRDLHSADTTSLATSATGVKRIMNSLLGWVRNSDDTLSVHDSAQRKAVTYTQANIQKWADGLRKDLEDIAAGRIKEDPITGEPINRVKVHAKAWFGKLSNKEVASQFERTLDHARREFDPDGRPGYFFKTPGELQDFYQRTWKRDPSYLETKAYFNFSKLIEGDRMMMEVSEFRNRARLGTEQHTLSIADKNTGETKSVTFDGIKLNSIPRTEDTVLIVGREAGDESLHTLNTFDEKRWKAMSEKVKKGEAQFIQVYDRDHQPLSNLSDITQDQHIQYVFTTKVSSKPIQFNHVERRGGGHFEWDYDQFLKQADVRPQMHKGINDKRAGFRNIYVGDKTIMPIKNRKMGQDIAKLWNEAQEFIKVDDWASAKPLVAKMGIKWEEFTGWYKPGRDAAGNPVRPMLNAHEPITVVDKNKKINQMGSELQDRYRINGKDTFKDATNSGPANNFKVSYNQERNSSFDMRTINDVGSQGNPIYAHQPAELVDPITTMNRALNRAVNSTFMDDYKITAVEGWLREAEPYLDASKSQVRNSPFQYFNKPEWRAGVDKTTIWGLEANRYKINQFVGVPNKFDTWVHSFTTQLADNFYAKYGPEEGRSVLQKAVTIVPLNMLHRVKDPVSYMRSITFNAKLGLGAIPQFLVQAQTHALIWALEPRHGTVGTYHSLLHNWAKFTDNPEILAKLDDYATKMNILGSKTRPGEFLEARRELERSGFETVAGEHSNLDQQQYRFIQNDWKKFLAMGQTPFRMGEQSTRQTAWFTAFREFREANPTVAIGNKERTQILSKADLLTVNMSRASASAINHGVFSLSTQFLSYQIKLAELFWGKRLGEDLTQRSLARARILSGFALLYGLPSALGVTGAPFSDNAREALMDSLGYIPGEKWYSTMVNEGLPAWTIAMTTGKLPNVGDRFGSQGFQNVKQALRGDVPMAIALGGAATSTFYNAFSSGLDPFWQYTLSRLRGDGSFKIKAADLVEPLKEISSYSMASKWLAAIETGKWINKNEQNVTDVTPLYATMLALTGMNPQEQDDMFTNNQMIKGEEEAKKRVMKDFIKDWRRGIEAKVNGDPEQGNAYHTNAFARAKVVGMNDNEISTAMAIGNRGFENAIDNSDWSLVEKGNVNSRDARIEQWKRKQKMKAQ